MLDSPQDDLLTLPELFAAQVVRGAREISVVGDDASISFADLDERSNRLARHLIDQGVGPEVVVALRMGRYSQVAPGTISDDRGQTPLGQGHKVGKPEGKSLARRRGRRS